MALLLLVGLVCNGLIKAVNTLHHMGAWEPNVALAGGTGSLR